ncbi:MAG: ricin-type beta-trefoil lectin domain protein [Chitinophagaceae bacterium]|nr:ricin-type beta-trefoil lectin domain protein [Oligoflexus sp.]
MNNRPYIAKGFASLIAIALVSGCNGSSNLGGSVKEKSVPVAAETASPTTVVQQPSANDTVAIPSAITGALLTCLDDAITDDAGTIVCGLINTSDASRIDLPSRNIVADWSIENSTPLVVTQQILNANALYHVRYTLKATSSAELKANMHAVKFSLAGTQMGEKFAINPVASEVPNSPAAAAKIPPWNYLRSGVLLGPGAYRCLDRSTVDPTIAQTYSCNPNPVAQAWVFTLDNKIMNSLGLCLTFNDLGTAYLQDCSTAPVFTIVNEQVKAVAAGKCLADTGDATSLFGTLSLMTCNTAAIGQHWIVGRSK